MTGRTHITIDKLYLISKVTQEVKKLAMDTPSNNRLVHWVEILELLMNEGGDAVFTRLRNIIEQNRLEVPEDIRTILYDKDPLTP